MITQRKQDFINHYTQLKNATEAAKRAGYSPKTAYSQGQRLLKSVEVREAVEAVFKAEAERLLITKDKVLANLWKEANNPGNKAADRIAANLGVAKIEKYIQDTATQNVALFAPITEDKARRILGTVQEGGTVDKPVETQ